MLPARWISIACLALTPLVVPLPAWPAAAVVVDQAAVDAMAAIVTELDETEVRLGADGSYTRRIRKRFQILNDRGKKLFSDAQFGYRPDDETITIDHAYTVDGAGVRHHLQPNAIADASPYSDEPAYDRYRVKSFTLPATGPGVTCEYQVTIRGKRSADRFSDSRYLQGSEPAETIRYSLVTPAKLPVRAQVVNPRADVAVTAEQTPEGAWVRRTWTSRRPKPLIAERQMPRWHDLATRVAISTTPSWATVSREWRGLTRGKDVATPELVALAKSITAKARTPQEKAAAIYAHVLKEIRYVAVDLAAAGVEPQAAAEVWRNRYGDCKDGSTLLKALLEAVDVPAKYVLVATNERGKLDRELPSLAQFDHCIVAAELPTGRVYLDSVGKTVGFGDLPAMDQGADAMVVGADSLELVTLPRSPVTANAIVSEQTLTLQPDGGLSTSVHEAFSGSMAASERQAYLGRTPRQVSDEFRRQSQSLVAGSRLLRHRVAPADDVTKPFATEFAYEAADFATVAGDLLIFKVPGTGYGLGLFSAEVREQPIQWWTTERYVDRATVSLPAGYRPRYLPPALTLETPEVSFKAGYRYAGGKLHYEAQTDYKTALITAANYPAVRQLFLERARFGKAVIVLEKVKSTPWSFGKGMVP